MSLKNRIGQLERASLRAAISLQEAIDVAAERDAAAIRRRCELLLEVTDDPARREDLLCTISKIEGGAFEPPASLPKAADDRAKEMRKRMLAAFGT